jgi:hypothetical protein
MKTITHNQHLKEECEKEDFTLPLQSLSVLQFYSHVRTNISNLSMRIVPVLRVPRAGLVALFLTSVTNIRIFWGIGLMGVVAPLAACVYMVFDRTDYVQGWYHVNNFHLFHILCPWLFVLACILGLFLMFKITEKRRYTAAIPAGYVIGKIIWLINTGSNEEYWKFVPWQFLLSGLLVAVVTMALMDYLTYRHFHGKDSLTRRFETIYNASDKLPADQIVSMFKKNFEEYKSFESKY